MNIKKKLTTFILTFAIVLSSGQVLSVQAATIDSKNTSNSSTTTQGADSLVKPGIPENKPNPLKVISQYNTVSINKSGNNGINITSTIGWREKNGNWFYYKSDYTKANGWINPDGNWYYLNSDGNMVTGWINYNNIWYYLDSSGVMVKGWKQLSNIWYFLNDSGAMVTGLNVIDNKTYVFDNSGAMTTGWKFLNNYWYYFNNSGVMSTSWVFDKGTRYYLYDTGAMAKGWINLNGSWYYLKESGAMVTGWVNSGNDYYFLDPATGSLITNTTIDGYKIGNDGKRESSANTSGDKNNSSSNTNNNSSGNNSTSSSKPGTAISNLYKGIDISSYSGDIDFKKVKAAGIQCVFIKATEGTTYIDDSLNDYYKGAKNSDLKIGFYHYLVGTSEPETQAQNFYNNIKDKKSDLKPVLDIETDDYNVMDYATRFIKEFKRLSNMDVCIYTYSNFIPNLDNRLAKYPLWEANFNTTFSNLPSNNIWSTRAGHQYTSKGTVDGINGNVDLDQFTKDIFK